MNELIQNNPRGLGLTYAVRVRGLPYLFTDGRATWTTFDNHTILADSLADADFGFTANTTPLDPLDVGTGLKIGLVDTPAGELRRLFSSVYLGPDNGTRLVGDYTVDDTGNVTLVDGSSIAVNDILYCGLETWYVTAKPTTDTATVTRAYYKSQRTSHRASTTEAASIGPRVTKSPRVFRGRYVEVFVAGIMPDGSADDKYTWWAGRLGSVSAMSNGITLDVDPLNAVMEDDSWPYVTASGTLGTETGNIYLPAASAFVNLQLRPASTNPRTVTGRLGYYDTANVYTELPADRYYSVTQLMTALSHTIQYHMLDSGLTQADGARNKFAVAHEVFDLNGTLAPSYVFFYKNDTTMAVYLDLAVGFGAYLSAYVGANPSSASGARIGGYSTAFTGQFEHSVSRRVFAAIPFTTDVILPQQTGIRVTLDSRWRPFTETGYSFPDLAAIGYAKISSGDRFEIVSYTGATLESDGRTMTLSGMQRGLAGTTALQWPNPEANEPETVRVEQLFFSSFNENQFLFQILLALLKSSSTYPNQYNGDYDFFGEYGGLAIPSEFVWHEDIIAKLRRQYLPKAFMFFVSEAGKGKAELTEWLKLFGIHFVTRRFQRGANWYYGLTVDIVDSTRLTAYNDVITDTERKGGSRPKVEYDERIVINQISYRPIYKFGEDASDENVGGMRYVYSEESIADYGAAKPMELKASAMFLGSQGYGGEYVSNPEDLQTGIATECALRWFGVYDHTVIHCELDTPHIGWRYQPGDQVLLSLAGAPSPTGGSDMSDIVGKVVRVSYRTGDAAGATIRFMITNTAGVEWAPSARITAVSGGTTLTLASNDFSDGNNTTPAIYGDPTTNYDGRWFRPTAYHPSAALPVVIYDAQDYAGTAVKTTVTTFTTVNSIVVSTDVSALAAAATAGRLYMTLQDAGDIVSARYNAHTFVDADKQLS